MKANAAQNFLIKETKAECKRRRGHSGLYDASIVEFLLAKYRERCSATEVAWSSFNGCCVTGIDLEKSPSPRPGLATAILAAFDGDGDGYLEQTEVELAALLIGVSASVEESDSDKRRATLVHLLGTADSRLNAVDPTRIDAASMLGRLITVDGIPHARVESCPKSSFLRRDRRFSLREVPSGRVLEVELQHSGNMSGRSWRPARPTHSLIAAIDKFGLPGRNPLLDVLDDMAPLARLEGADLSKGRGMNACLAESKYRLCAILPCWPCLPCFWPHALLVSLFH